jgi:hypothetical protein
VNKIVFFQCGWHSCHVNRLQSGTTDDALAFLTLAAEFQIWNYASVQAFTTWDGAVPRHFFSASRLTKSMTALEVKLSAFPGSAVMAW